MKKLMILLAATIVFSSCKKEGLDGDATLVVTLKHHGLIIPNQSTYLDSVFLAFDTQDLPDDPIGGRDALFVGVAGENTVRCEGLKWGDYYVYCTGWDTAINERVKGGIPVRIEYNQRKDEISLDVPVVE